MVLRWLFRSLVNNAALIDRLSRSYPVRRAAQLTVYWFRRSQTAVEDAAKSPIAKLTQKDVESGVERLQRFKQTLSSEIKVGMKELGEEIKKSKRR